jgi:hypothetical protein
MTRLKAAWRLLNLPCKGMSHLAAESLDRDLDRMERLALRLHLLYCIACRRYNRQIRLLRKALRQFPARLESDPLSFGPGLPDDVRARIKRALMER